MERHHSPDQRRDAIVCELIPLAAGFLLLAFFGFFSHVSPDLGEPFDTIVIGPLVLLTMLAALAFPFSGLGWLITGRRIIGVSLLVGRLYLVSYVYAGSVHSAGDLSRETAAWMYVLAMAIPVISALVLAYVVTTPATRSQA